MRPTIILNAEDTRLISVEKHSWEHRCAVSLSLSALEENHPLVIEISITYFSLLWNVLLRHSLHVGVDLIYIYCLTTDLSSSQNMAETDK